MKLLHTSDWHLGRVLHDRPLLPDQLVFLAQLIALLRDDPHDALIIAGDVFDRSIPPEDAVERFGDFLRDLRAACPALPIVLIAGNHDSAARLAYASPLLAAAGVHVRGAVDPTLAVDRPVRVRGAEGDEAEIWPLPFLWPGALGAHAEGEEASIGTQESVFVEALRRLRDRRDPSAHQVLVAHCFAAGGVVSDSERTLIGTATQIDAACFADFDYVALGHLHRPQRVSANAWYSGSPLEYSFSEAGDPKVLLSVTLSRGAPPEVRKIPIAPPRGMSILRGPLRELLEDPRHLAHVDRYLRIELTDADPAAQPMALLRARFPYLLDLRVPRPEAPEGRMAPAERRARADVEQDFLDFERRLRGEAPMPDGLLDAFRALRASVRGGEA
jgi:exonuclease SbcD